MFRKNYEEAIQQYKNVLESKEGWEEGYIYVYGNLGYCYAKLLEWDKAIEAYMRTFQYGTPRGEMCVGIGDAMMAQQKYKEAIRWYLAAT
ncbi:beta 1,4 glucosyltransferase, partial [Bacillus cereus]